MTIEDLQHRPTSAVSEAQLEQGGLGRRGPLTLTEPCSCGDVIVAEDDTLAIADAVRAHNQSTGHQQWAAATGWRDRERR